LFELIIFMLYHGGLCCNCGAKGTATVSAAAVLTAAAMVPLIFAAAEPVAAAAATNSTTDESGKDVIEDLRHMTSFIVPFTIVAFVFLLSQRFLK
jgi:hypothetical protein